MKKDDTNQSQKLFAKTISAVMLISLVGKATGLARDILMNARMGAESFERTALDPALTIPTQFLDFAFAAALSSSFIPVFNDYLMKNGKKEAFSLADSFITVVFALSLFVVGLGIVFAAPIIAFFAPGITDIQTITLAVKLLRVMLPSIALTAMAFSLTGVLQSLGEFNAPAAMSVLSNVIIITYFGALYDRFGVTGVAVAFLVGWVTQVCILVPPLFKRGYVFKPKISKSTFAGLKQIALLTPPVIISTWVTPVNVLVNKNAASRLYDGAGMNVLTAANALYSVITGVFILSAANVIFPALSRQASGGDEHGFCQTLNSTLKVCAVVLIPMSVGLAVVARPAVRLLYEWGEFSAVSSERTSQSLMFFALGMAGLGFYTILSRAAYATKDAFTPVIASVIAIAINAALSFPLTNILQSGGPALASSVSITAAAVVTLILLKRRHRFFGKDVLTLFLKTAVSSAATGLAAYCVMKLLPDFDRFFGRVLAAGLPVFAGIAAFLIVSLLLKTEELGFLWKKIRKS
ncbi:putative lipid II flippase MurJ [Clostridia bacterium]|nr:putative lipid II flippase MurJ [Clostridia bacterium]